MKNGYWIDAKSGLVCSECGITQECNLYNRDFCLCCEADMREKRYFIKSLLVEWREVTRERYFEYIEQIRNRCLTDPDKFVEKYTKTEIKGD